MKLNPTIKSGDSSDASKTNNLPVAVLNMYHFGFDGKKWINITGLLYAF